MIHAVAASNVATSRAAVAVLQARENKVVVLREAREHRVVAGGNRGHANKVVLPANKGVATASNARPVSKTARASREGIGVVVTAVAATVLRQAQDRRATALPAIDPRAAVVTVAAIAAAVANNARPDRPRKTSSNTAYIIYMYSEPFCLQDGFLFFNFN
jgi:hypothetical protein